MAGLSTALGATSSADRSAEGPILTCNATVGRCYCQEQAARSNTVTWMVAASTTVLLNADDSLSRLHMAQRILLNSADGRVRISKRYLELHSCTTILNKRGLRRVVRALELSRRYREIVLAIQVNHRFASCTRVAPEVGLIKGLVLLFQTTSPLLQSSHVSNSEKAVVVVLPGRQRSTVDTHLITRAIEMHSWIVAVLPASRCWLHYVFECPAFDDIRLRLQHPF